MGGDHWCDSCGETLDRCACDTNPEPTKAEARIAALEAEVARLRAALEESARGFAGIRQRSMPGWVMDASTDHMHRVRAALRGEGE